jgi:hypothetical protein
MILFLFLLTSGSIIPVRAPSKSLAEKELCRRLADDEDIGLSIAKVEWRDGPKRYLEDADEGIVHAFEDNRPLTLESYLKITEVPFGDDPEDDY